MDLDAARKVASSPLCFRCKLLGYFTKDCPTRYDVWAMTVEELEEELNIRIAQLDVAPPDQEEPLPYEKTRIFKTTKGEPHAPVV